MHRAKGTKIQGGVVIGVEQPLIHSASASASSGKFSPHIVNSGAMTSIGTKPTLIEVQRMKFLIMDAPRQSNLHLYIKEMRKHGVTEVTRVCEPTYQGAELQTAGINLNDMEYPDGHSPPNDIIDTWLKLVDKTFFSNTASGTDNKVCIAVHCVAGLGRAPVMVALALIEFSNMDPVEAVSLIRRHRRGAINEKQLLYLEGYKRHYRKQAAEGGCCIIS
jgi:protein tyrosine phosphatase type 4A